MPSKEKTKKDLTVQYLISVGQARRRAFGEECCGHEQPFPLVKPCPTGVKGRLLPGIMH